MMYTALATFLFKGKEPWTLSNTSPDSAKTGLAADHKEIEYPKPDGKISFDLLTAYTMSSVSPMYVTYGIGPGIDAIKGPIAYHSSR